ncbi:MAG: 3-hydroxyacyl-CoA dehydrogenase family protein [Burkholderiales bacterium]
MAHQVIQAGDSRSFPTSHALIESASSAGDIVVLIGAKPSLAAVPDTATLTAVLVELGTECLGDHTGESRGKEGSNVLGFARFRMGDAAPTDLVELVKQPNTKPEAVAAAKALLEGAGLKVAVCNDFPGRIIDRLIRPYLNAALRRLDEKLASAEDMDTTLKLGLGYPEGPISLLERTGLTAHRDVTQALYEALGDAAYAPARRAQVAKARGES